MPTQQSKGELQNKHKQRYKQQRQDKASNNINNHYYYNNNLINTMLHTFITTNITVKNILFRKETSREV
jgi:hypothetical protein